MLKISKAEMSSFNLICKNKLKMVNEFDLKAKTWDENPTHTERSIAIANALLELVPVNNKMNVLEFGAGTGILSFLLADKFNSLTLIDSSSEMVKITNEKIKVRAISNMKAKCFDLELENYDGCFDMIYNQMVMHHTVNIDLLLDKFKSMILPGGFLVIADLFPEDGSFHGEGFTGHKGFEPMVLSEILAQKGFKNIWSRECYSIRKTITENKTKEYPVFILTAQKN